MASDVVRPQLLVVEAHLNRLLKDHAKDDKARESLRRAIVNILNGLAIHDRRRDELTPRGRQRRLAAFERLLKCLQEATKILEGLSPLARVQLCELLAMQIAANLTDRAFRGALRGFTQDISLRVLETVEHRRPQEVYEALEEDAGHMRMAAAQRDGERVLASLLREMAQTIERQVFVERQDDGGAPASPYRQYILIQLAKRFPEIFGKLPTKTKNGAYARLAADVLHLFELPTDGLDSAIDRVLRSKRGRKSRRNVSGP